MKHKTALMPKPLKLSLRNGKEIAIRLLGSNDGKAFVKFYGNISPQDNRYYIGRDSCTEKEALIRASKYNRSTEVALVINDCDNNIYGEAWYRWEKESDNTSVFGIYISRDLQGEGIGKAIMTELMNLSKHYGPPIMSLTVQKENERALNLYQKLGFKIIREQTRPARANCEELPEYYMERSCQQTITN